jgi:hypothetical protein
MVFDIILCALLAAAFALGCKKGFLRTIWGLSALIITIVLTGFLRPFAAESFENSVFAKELNAYVYSMVSERSELLLSAAESTAAETAAALDTSYTLPEKYTQPMAEKISDSVQTTVASIADTITAKVVALASGIFVFILIRLLLAIIYRILKFAFSLPVLKQSNRLAGGIVQLLIAITAAYLVFAVTAILGKSFFEETVICKYMFDNNLLFTFIGL